MVSDRAAESQNSEPWPGWNKLFKTKWGEVTKAGEVTAKREHKGFVSEKAARPGGQHAPIENTLKEKHDSYLFLLVSLKVKWKHL